MQQSATPVRRIDDFAEACVFLNDSRRLGGMQLPERIRQGIAEMFGAPLTAEQVVDRIINDVRERKDEAVSHYTRLIDKAVVRQVEVTASEIDAAMESVDDNIIQALRFAAAQIEKFHQRQLRTSWINFDDDGATGQIIRPLERVGIYTPGGTAPYPSSLLMTAIPARVAGVEEIIVATPPGKDGTISPLILVAARIAGVERVIKVGGAQAIAAMAYGTESIPKVDKILGPGNLFVVLAKKRVYGDVDIDQLPGPTETLLVADESADAELCAADMLAQAEHDMVASAILITTSTELADNVEQQLKSQLATLSREEIARASLQANGAIIVADDLDQTFDLANLYAPEHLCLLVKNPWEHVDRVKHAGGIFVGESSPEVIGDYTGGPSHVMPTGQTARFSSPVNVEEFIKIISLLGVNERGLARLGPPAAQIARAEGLTAHAGAVERRLKRLEDNER